MITVKLFLSFAKIGVLGFGGGLAILPLIYQGVNEFHYMSEADFANLVAIAQSTPGPIAVNAATYVGYETAGFLGALGATIGVSVPSFILVILTLKAINKFKESTLVKGMLIGVKPAAAGMVTSAFVFIAEGALLYGGTGEGLNFLELLGDIDPIAVGICIATVILGSKLKLGFFKLIIIMGFVGAVLCS